jgi:hypothetical protein
MTRSKIIKNKIIDILIPLINFILFICAVIFFILTLPYKLITYIRTSGTNNHLNTDDRE